MKPLLDLLAALVRVAGRLYREPFAQAVAALSFTTLLALVPMIAIAVVWMSHLPFADNASTAIQHFLLDNLLPDKAGNIIARQVTNFTHRASAMTAPGIAVLALSAIMQMFTIERAINAVWRTHDKRPWLRRLTWHVLALLLGPMVFGCSLALITYAAGFSFGLLREPAWVRLVVFNALSFAFMVALFAWLYTTAPYRRVRLRHALTGGTFAALGFTALQQAFSAFIAMAPSYRVLYGAFAALPIFLSWLYASWAIILTGALLVAELDTGKSLPKRHQ